MWKKKRTPHPPSLGCEFEALVITWIQNPINCPCMLQKFLDIDWYKVADWCPRFERGFALSSTMIHEHFARDTHYATDSVQPQNCSNINPFWLIFLLLWNNSSSIVTLSSNIYSAPIAHKITKNNWRLHYPVLSPRFDVWCMHVIRGSLWSRTQRNAWNYHYATERCESGIKFSCDGSRSISLSPGRPYYLLGPLER